jgi:hypothetical protein
VILRIWHTIGAVSVEYIKTITLYKISIKEDQTSQVKNRKEAQAKAKALLGTWRSKS